MFDNTRFISNIEFENYCDTLKILYSCVPYFMVYNNINSYNIAVKNYFQTDKNIPNYIIVDFLILPVQIGYFKRFSLIQSNQICTSVLARAFNIHLIHP